MEIVRAPPSRATPLGQAINVWQRRRGVIMGAWAFLNRCDDYDRCAFLGQRSTEPGRKCAAPSAACSRPIEQLVFKFNQYCHTFSPKITVVARNLRLHAADSGF